MIGLVGGGVVLAATASAGGFLATRRPSRALAPWSAAGSYSEPRMNALSYAILAPNPHNRQPWVAELQGDNQLIIHRDKTLNLPDTDPLFTQRWRPIIRGFMKCWQRLEQRFKCLVG